MKRIEKFRFICFDTTRINTLEFGQRSGKTYPVVGGIKSLSIQYTSKTVKKTEPKAEKIEDKKDTKAQQTPAKKQKPTIDTTYTLNIATWDSDEYIKKSVKKEGIQETTYPIPVFVDIEAIVYDTQQREIKIRISIPIITDTEIAEKRRLLSFMSLFKPQQVDDEKKIRLRNPHKTPQQQGLQNAFMPNTQLRKQLDNIFKPPVLHPAKEVRHENSKNPSRLYFDNNLTCHITCGCHDLRTY